MSQQQKCKVWECQAQSMSDSKYCINCYESKYRPKVKCSNCGVRLGYYSTHTCEVKEKVIEDVKISDLPENWVKPPTKPKLHPLGMALKSTEDYCVSCLEIYDYRDNVRHTCPSLMPTQDRSVKDKLRDCILSQIKSATDQVGKLDLEIGIYRKILKQLEML